MKPSMLLDAFWVLVTRFVMRAANLVVFMLLARGLDQEAFGHYGYVMASVLMLTVVFDVGLRQSSGFYLGKSGEEPGKVVTQILLLWLGLMLIGTCAMAGVMVWGGFSTPFLALVLATATLGPALLVRMAQGAFLGLGKIKELNKSELASRALLLAGTLALWLLDALTIESALAVLFASYVGASALLAWQLRDLLAWPRLDTSIARPLLRTGLTFAGGIIAMILLGRIGVWIVNAQLGTADVGAYFAVMRLSEMIAEVATAVGVVIFSHGVRTEDRREAALATARTARCVVAVMAVAGIVAVLLAEPLIALTVGEAYVAAAGAFRILVAGAVLSCFSMMLYPGLSSQGEARWGLRVFGPGTLLAAGLCWLLAPAMGVVGAAIAMASAQAVVAIALVLVYRKIFEIPLVEIALPQREDIQAITGLLSRLRRRGARPAPSA